MEGAATGSRWHRAMLLRLEDMSAHTMGSADPQCHCSAPATEARSAKEPLGMDLSAQGISFHPREKRAPGERKGDCMWEGGDRDEFLRGWWESWLGEQLRAESSQQWL